MLTVLCGKTTASLQEDELIQSENSASIFNTLSDIPSQIEDADVLLREAMRVAGSLTDVAVETQRRKHLAYLIADQGQLLNSSTTVNNLSKVSALSSICLCCSVFTIPLYFNQLLFAGKRSSYPRGCWLCHPEKRCWQEKGRPVPVKCC